MRLIERVPMISTRPQPRPADRIVRVPAARVAEATRRTYGRVRENRGQVQQRGADGLWRQRRTYVIVAGVGVAAVAIGVSAVRARSRTQDRDVGAAAPDAALPATGDPSEELETAQQPSVDGSPPAGPEAEPGPPPTADGPAAA
jgi:hypothetical protein